MASSSGGTSGRLPGASHSHRAGNPTSSGSPSPTMRPVQLQPSTSTSEVPPAVPLTVSPRHRFALLGGMLAVALAAIVTVRAVQSRQGPIGSQPQIDYAMACRICKARFSMPAETYRTQLAGRSNKNFNRIRCPKCGADDAAFRTESGMDGLGELDSDGTAVVNPRQIGGGPPVKSKATRPTN